MEARKIFLEELRKLEASMGLQAKDPVDGSYVTSADLESDAHSAISSTWGSIDTLFPADVPPYYKEPHLREVLQSSSKVKDFLLQKMRWSVGTIRTATWKLTAPDLGALQSALFLVAGSSTVIRTLSGTEYLQLKNQGTKGQGQGGKGVQGQQGSNPNKPHPDHTGKPNTSREATTILPEKRATALRGWAKRPRTDQ